MLKYFTFVISLFAIEVSLAQDLTATLKMPEVIAPGEDYIVEITVTKGAINSYIKFSQKLPPHFKATEIETSGGSFTFDDSIVKIIWFFPPAKNEFTFSYKVNVPEDASGVKKIGGKIYYFFNTNREVFSFEKKYITIGTAKDIIASKQVVKVDSILSDISSTKNIEPILTNTLVITTIDTTVTNIVTTSLTTNTIIKVEEPKDTVAESKINPITKTISETALMKDTLATPITNIISKVVSTTKDTLAVYTTATISKVALVKDTSVTPITNVTSKVVSTTKDTSVVRTTATISKAAPVKDTSVTPITNTISKVVPTKDTLVAARTSTTTKATQINITTANVPTKTKNKTEPAAGELSYCVQLGTFKEEVPLELANKFFKISARGIKNFKDNNGFTTFTVGNFKTHDEAINLKNEMLEKGFQGAFIVAFPTNNNTLSPTINKTIETTTQVNNTRQSSTTNTTTKATPANNTTVAPSKITETETIVTNTTAITTSTKFETKIEPKVIPEEVVKASINAVHPSANRSYGVQIGAFKEEVPLETANKFLKIAAKGVKNLKDNKGLTVYTVGNFPSHDEAVVLKNEMIEKGFQGAFIITFENGKIVK